MNPEVELVCEQAPARSKLSTMLLLLLVAFVGGALAAGWAIVRYDLDRAVPFIDASREQPAPATADTANTLKSADGMAAIAPVPRMLTPEAERALASRVADLEYRLSQINIQAEAASGKAARAEGLLIAFAARRALDRGSQLGYIEGQLRLRFGNSQPRAVRTIIAASRQPVTLEQLQGGLNDLSQSVTLGKRDGDMWRAAGRELRELFVLRKEGSPSPAPTQRLERARRFTQAGNIEAAIAEVSKLPGADVAAGWLEQARQYQDVRDALDLIENAAILEPRQLRTADLPVSQRAVAVPR